MHENQDQMDWQNKIAKIEIKKDNCRLIYTARHIVISDGLITFNDREGVKFSFPTTMVAEMQEVKPKSCKGVR